MPSCLLREERALESKTQIFRESRNLETELPRSLQFLRKWGYGLGSLAFNSLKQVVSTMISVRSRIEGCTETARKFLWAVRLQENFPGPGTSKGLHGCRQAKGMCWPLLVFKKWQWRGWWENELGGWVGSLSIGNLERCCRLLHCLADNEEPLFPKPFGI